MTKLLEKSIILVISINGETCATSLNGSKILPTKTTADLSDSKYQNFTLQLLKSFLKTLSILQTVWLVLMTI